MRQKTSLLFFFSILSICKLSAQELQPFVFSVENLLETLEYLGTPVQPQDASNIKNVMLSNDANTIPKINALLEKYTLFEVSINPESRVKVTQGLVVPQLVQNGWQTFLVKVQNEAGITSKFEVFSPQSKKVYNHHEHNSEGVITKKDIADRWLDMSLYTTHPMKNTLSGVLTEYFIIQLYSRDAGKRAAKIGFTSGPITQDLGFRDVVNVLFDCKPSSKIQLEILDENGNPTTASIIIKDKNGKVYPSQAKRLAPDFFFQKQIYRHDGEHLELASGTYYVTYGRGPEYITKKIELIVSDEEDETLQLQLERWIDPSKWGWYSGDHHIHAAGCSHYTNPTEGVDPADMMRHVLGEGVNIGSVLTWGPGYYHQKQFFEGKDNALSTKNNILRYDLEISGFPSGHSGHIVLLRLKDQYYPNAKVIEDWPSWTLPILKWAKDQNAITGFAHSGLGLEVMNDSLPNYEMPKFDGIGANEFVVAVTQNTVDFISTMDTPPTWELNIWYHVLNSGFRTRISGETDFPCLSDDMVAHGRSYVKVDGNLTFDKWADGLRLGTTYVSEGKSHLMDFKVNDLEVGTANSELQFEKPEMVQVTAKVAAYLEPENQQVPQLDLSKNVWAQRPFWNIERARLGDNRKVLLELVVNGEVASTKEIEADGTIQDVHFETAIEKSSWVAIRIRNSSHSNPIFVVIDGKPIRASKKSAQWCLKAVDVCWEQKVKGISKDEIAAAKKDYEAAKEVYRHRIKEFED